jgi:hypothetical protein
MCRFLDAGKYGTAHAQATGVKKRQGTKSREVGHGLGSKRYGDLMSAPSSMVGGTLARRQSNVCREGKPGECNGHFDERSERINGRSAH